MRMYLTTLALFLFSLADAPRSVAQQVEVKFLQNTPVIDGIPDAGLEALMRPLILSASGKTASKPGIPQAQLRIGYGTSFLYLLIRVESDTITYRDRAYQNGDGFHFTLARPRPGDSATDEFFVIRCSPGDSLRGRPAKISRWYYNVDLAYQPLKDAVLKTSSKDGATWYELFVPWDKVPPYHPFFGETGFNLCFVKAVGSSDKAMLFLVPDGKMQSEGSLRKYIRLSFEAPFLTDGCQVFMEPERKNIVCGGEMNCHVAFVSGKQQMRRQAAVTVMGLKGDTTSISRTDLQPDPGLSFKVIPVPVNSLSAGSYTVGLALSTGSEKIHSVVQPFTVLPEFRSADLIRRLSEVKVSPGSASSFRFRVDDIDRRINRIRPYDTAGSLAGEIQATAMIMEGFEGGGDYFSEQKGILRRAYSIPGDPVLYPYTVKVPATYDRHKTYPVLVFLHGSGEDDRGILTYTRLTEGDFIEVAPNGRNVSNCFATPEALDDIRRAIDDVIRNYSVDTSMMVIGGFSMGGYGTMRAFYESPKRYRGVAIVSGHPDLASRWLGGEHPDFTDAPFLACFRDVPVFVYHSESDRNCPWDLAQMMISGLKTAGARLTILTTTTGGHSLMDEASRLIFYNWLRSLTGNQDPNN